MKLDDDWARVDERYSARDCVDGREDSGIDAGFGQRRFQQPVEVGGHDDLHPTALHQPGDRMMGGRRPPGLAVGVVKEAGDERLPFRDGQSEPFDQTGVRRAFAVLRHVPSFGVATDIGACDRGEAFDEQLDDPPSRRDTCTRRDPRAKEERVRARPSFHGERGRGRALEGQSCAGMHGFIVPRPGGTRSGCTFPAGGAAVTLAVAGGRPLSVKL